MALRSFLNFLAWFTAAFTYYGLVMNVGLLAGSIYVNMVISAILEFVAYFVSKIMMNTRLGRKLPTCGCYIIAGLALFFTLAVPLDKPLIVTVLTTFGRFCACCFYNGIYIWTAELMPTSLRNRGLSTTSCLGKIGSVVAPFTEQLVYIHPAMPTVVLGSMTLLCGLLLFLLPETRGKPLPQTMSDIIGEKLSGKAANTTELESMTV